MSAETVDFYCDPVCPWTWMTSRWLVDVAEQRGLTVRWHPLSLDLLHGGAPLPPQFDTPAIRVFMDAAGRAIRVLAALSADGDHERAGRFYAEFGRRLHDGEADAGEVDDGDPFVAAVAAAEVADALDRAADSAVDDELAAALKEALSLAGPDVGSPVLRIGDSARGFHGPILSPRLTGAAGLRVYDAVVSLQGENAFFELKRGRSDPPEVAVDPISH